MRILHVSLDGNLPRYGVGLAVARLVGALAAAGDDVVLACREGNAAAAAGLGARVLPLVHRRGLLGSRRSYVAQVASLSPRPEVVHVHAVTRIAHWLSPPRARAGAPLVVTCHSEEELGPSASPAGTAPPGRARRHRTQAREVLARADAVVVASRHARALARAAGAPEARLHDIGLAPTDDSPAPRRSHPGHVVVGLLRLVESKGPFVLLEAFRRAFPSDSGARLVLAGEGPLRDALAERARSLGIESRVSLPGWVAGAERTRLLAEADVVAVPSIAGETFCLAALDAQAAGVPVVVSDQGALPERGEGGAALVVPAGDVDSLAQALTRVRSDPALASSLSERGIEAARAHRWPDVAARHRALYERVGYGPTCSGSTL